MFGEVFRFSNKFYSNFPKQEVIRKGSKGATPEKDFFYRASTS